MDVLWGATFSDLAKDSSEALAMKNKFHQTANTINEKLKEYQHEIVSFEQTFVTEIAGALNASEDLLSEVILRLYRRQSNPIKQVAEEQLRNTRRQMRMMFTNLFRLKRSLVAKRLPTIYMQALCHAAFRMDVRRKFNGNFLRDLHHGTAGVVYYDAVLTEKPLAVLLTSGNVAADKFFGCRVMSDEHDVLAYLETL